MPVVLGKPAGRYDVTPKHAASFGWLAKNARKIVELRASKIREPLSTHVTGWSLAAEAVDGRIFYHVFGTQRELAETLNRIKQLQGRPVYWCAIDGTYSADTTIRVGNLPLE